MVSASFNCTLSLLRLYQDFTMPVSLCSSLSVFFFFSSEKLVHFIGRLGNSLLCIDVQLRHLIRPPPLSSNIASRASLATTFSSFRSNNSVSSRFFFSRFLSVFPCSYFNALTMYLLEVIFAVDSFFVFRSMEKIIVVDSLQLYTKFECNQSIGEKRISVPTIHDDSLNRAP